MPRFSLDFASLPPVTFGFGKSALSIASLTTLLLLCAAFLGGAIRVLPWVLDPAIPWRVAAPFVRSLAALAIEAAFITGWPIGWALAAHRLVERGEARLLLTLGERPSRTALSLWPYGLVFGASLALASFVGGRDAEAPGRVVNELIAEGRAACQSGAVNTSTVPFANVTWLCTDPPRLVGAAPGGMGGGGNLLFTAREAEVSRDLRRIDLADARIAVNGASVHVSTMVIRGLAPWARASSLPSVWRALLLLLSGLLASTLSAYVVLRSPRRRGWGRFFAMAVGAMGPVAALATLRLLERSSDDTLVYYILVPFSALVSTAVLGLLASRLPVFRMTASK